GRREWGLVAASVYTWEEERRRLLSAPYVAERTGQGVSIAHDLEEQGEAPPDRLPRIMEGVVRRGGEELGEPREVVLAGAAEAFEALMKELGSGDMEPAFPHRPPAHP